MEKRYKDYLTRFILLHVITYAVIGIIFYQLQDYEGAFEVQEDFKLFRPTDHPLVKYSVFIQILRGGILAMFLHPFYHIFMDRKHGWILLFILLFGLTVVGSMVLIPNFIIRLTEVSFIQLVDESIVGLPEVVVQILLFSWLFVKWEKKKIEQPNKKVQ